MIKDSANYIEFRNALYVKIEQLTKALQDTSVDYEGTQEIRYRLRQIKHILDFAEGRIPHLH